jgi:hypothetical protein
MYGTFPVPTQCSAVLLDAQVHKNVSLTLHIKTANEDSYCPSRTGNLILAAAEGNVLNHLIKSRARNAYLYLKK